LQSAQKHAWSHGTTLIHLGVFECYIGPESAAIAVHAWAGEGAAPGPYLDAEGFIG